MAEKGSIFEKDNKSEAPEELQEQHEFLESEEQAETQGDAEIKFHVGDKEADIYTESGREELTVDEEEIKPWEEGFAEGATQRGKDGTCAHCKKVLGDREEGVIEREYGGKLMLFCSEKCAGAGPQK